MTLIEYFNLLTIQNLPYKLEKDFLRLQIVPFNNKQKNYISFLFALNYFKC